MARGRMVSTTVATDISLNSLSMEAEYLFLKTLPHLDRDGLILADAPILWGNVCPRRPDLLPRIDEYIAEWEAARLVISFQTTDGRALFFPGFAKNQNFQYSKEGKSTIPAPPGYVRTNTGLVPEQRQNDSGTTLEEGQSNSRVSLDELPEKLREVKLREVEEKCDNRNDWWAAWAASFPGLMVNPNDRMNLQPSADKYGPVAMVKAIEHANKHKRTPTITIRYVESILEGWERDGKLPADDADDKPAGPERSVFDGYVYERQNGQLVRIGKVGEV